MPGLFFLKSPPEVADAGMSCYLRTRKFAIMRTNGFILIILGFTAGTVAGTANYLPSVGPVGLRFASKVEQSRVVTLPPPAAIQADPGPAPREDMVAEIPVTPAAAASGSALMHEIPVLLSDNLTNGPGPSQPGLIGPMMDTNNVITPQMFLRFFTPAPGGVSREAIVVPPTDFNPALPPTRSSTATYTQPKP